MSKSWQGGSTPAWRRVRQLVLDRDGYVCGLCGEAIPRGLDRNHPRSAQVHHVRDRRLHGDDPRYLQAAHRLCNQQAGEPGTGSDGDVVVPAWVAKRMARHDANYGSQ